MFNNFKEKMNNFYKELKVRVSSPEKKPTSQTSSQRPQKIRENRRLDNSLHMGRLNQTDLDLQKLDDFRMGESFNQSSVISENKRVNYYDARYTGLMDSQKKTIIRRDTGSSRKSHDSGFYDPARPNGAEEPGKVTSNFRKGGTEGKFSINYDTYFC